MTWVRGRRRVLTGPGKAWPRCVLLVAAAWMLASIASAGPTDPVLAIFEVRELPARSHVMLVIEAEIPEADLAQLPLELHLLVRQLDAPGRYLRFEFSGSAFGGADASIGASLDPEEALALTQAGAHEPDARLGLTQAGTIEVQLGSDFPAGPAEVQLWLVEDDGVVLSNPVSHELSGAAP